MDILTNFILILTLAIVFLFVAYFHESFNTKKAVKIGIIIIIVNAFLILTLILNLINLID